MNKILEIFEKLQRFFPSGKVAVYIKGILFLNVAFFFGLWLGLRLFFPDDFILSKINNVLFVKDMGLTADDVSISPLGSISFYDGILTKKGDDIVTFRKLKFSPSLLSLMSGDISGDVYLEDINNQGGELDVSFETSMNPCYSFDIDEISLSLVNAFMTDISFTGIISGEGNICMSENQKYSGNVEFKGNDVVLRGKLPTPMGPFDIGSIDLGEIEIISSISENKVDVEKFLMSGLFNFDILGKIVLNSKVMVSSRLDLDVRVSVADLKKLAENATLNLLVSQMSQYKTDKENDFAFMLRGFLTKPQMSKAPKERVAGKSNLNPDEAREKRAERVKSRSSKRKIKPISGDETQIDGGIKKDTSRFGSKPEILPNSEPVKEEIIERSDRPERSQKQERPERQTRPQPVEMEPVETRELPVEELSVEEERSPREKARKETVEEEIEAADSTSESNDNDGL